VAKDRDTLQFDFAVPEIHWHVLSWLEPLPRSAARWLAFGWKGEGPLDLSTWLVVVPTRQSGRRLREALAAFASEAGQAVFPPRVVLPETIATLGPVAVPVASRAEQQLAWVEALQTIDLSDYRAVFPVEPPTRSFTWARELASQLVRLQGALGEAGLTIADVPARVASGQEEFPEAERWTQLARLAGLADACLEARHLQPPQQAQVRFAAAPELPPGVERIVLLATPDPLPLAVQIFARHAAHVPLDVVIYGPTEESRDALFDEWGRPRPDVWSQRFLAWPDFEKRVHVCADPEAQAAWVVGIARGLKDPEGILGVGVADADVLPPLEHDLARAGVSAYNPAGRPWKLEGLYALLAALADLARTASWDATRAVLRCPDVLAWIGGGGGGAADFSVARLLGELDTLGENHLPPTLAVAIDHAQAHPKHAERALVGLSAAARLRDLLVAGAFPASAVDVLQLIFADRRLETGSLFFEAVEVWTETLRDTGAALSKFRSLKLSLGEAWEFTLALYGERIRFADKPSGAVELNGWLELLWDDAPHLVVAGLNDGRVPEAVVGDAFLPETLRARIGLKTNAARFARDAYLLQALDASRTGGAGRLDVLVGKASANGDPLRPSRLLLRCPDEELPRRVAWLFREVGAVQASLPWTRAWRLRPREVAPPTRVSVTALRDWLACPFRFYLKHALRMKRVEPDKAELDARDFGTLLHATLQRLADPDVRACTDAERLRDFLLGHFERAARRRYGDLLTLPLLVQFESARQRLRKVAEVEARERAAGWRIDRVEWKFELPLGGLAVSGTIDRVDRHESDPARTRVIDYKTADTPSAAQAAHLRTFRPADDAREPWQRVRIGNKERVWIDLQLPLYRRAMAAEFGDGIECGYFNLPKAAGETALEIWADLTPDLQSAAERCAEGVVGAIGQGRFWPPAEADAENDEWAELFHHGAAASVDPESAVRLAKAAGVSV